MNRAAQGYWQGALPWGAVSLIEATIAVNRFGLGAAPGELERVAVDPRGWLSAQLAPSPAPDALARRPDTGALMRAAARQKGKDHARKLARALYMDEASDALKVAVASERGFHERLVAFWSNHVAVSVKRAKVLGLAGAYEREAVRPRVTGRYQELLIAAMKHPAMLLYLDNNRSVGPDSPVGQRQEKGLNENLARELLELHTLGVDGGYTQSDVESLAAILTGWGLSEEKDGFLFSERRHQPGRKLLLGRRYGEGLEEGERALAELARHPSTARHLSRKLASHFSSDAPPPALVAALEEAWMDTWGDLGAVYAALLAHPDAWTPDAAKIKSPRDLVISTARAVGDRSFPLYTSVEKLGQQPWAPDSPQGFPDTAAAWLGPAAVLQRVEWAAFMAARSRRVEPAQVGGDALGASLTARTRRWISASATREEGLALLLASPEFQRR